LRLHHRLDGPDGEPVLVLANSIGTTLELWDAQVSALARRFRVLRYDQLGHGRSEVAPGPYTVELLGRELVALLDELGIERACFAGISLGGAVGMWLAAERPERVERLVLACTSARFGDPEVWRERADGVRRDGMEAVTEASLGRWFTPSASPEAVERFRRMLLATPAEGYAACCDALGAWDFREQLGGVRASTLVVAASEDPSTPPDHGRLLATRIPDARLHVIDGAAHLVNVERPAEFTDIVLEHLLGPPADRGMRVRREVLGDEHVDGAIARTTDLTRDFQNLIVRYAWGEIWARPGLDRRMRSAVTLTALVALGRDHELAMHVRAALRNGLTADEIGEVLLQTAVYCGVPAANSAFAVAQRVLEEEKEGA
jgi:3-oxoadipate enol-lactonase/4-carboxymuconolactone decarboxylase